MLGLSRSRLLEKLRDRRWKKLRPGWTLTSGIKVRICSEGEWIVFSDLFVDGEYDPAFAALFARRKEGDNPPVVLDLGANVGYFVFRLFHLWRTRYGESSDLPRVHAFEASDSLVHELESRISDQGFPMPVAVFNGLVGQRQGNASFAEDTFHIANRVDDRGRRQVPYLDVEENLPADKAIDLLKCDIEGSEFDFISSYPDLLDRTQLLLIELHDSLCDVPKCRALLAQRGFGEATVLRKFRDFSVELFARP